MRLRPTFTTLAIMERSWLSSARSSRGWRKFFRRAIVASFVGGIFCSASVLFLPVLIFDAAGMKVLATASIIFSSTLLGWLAMGIAIYARRGQLLCEATAFCAGLLVWVLFPSLVLEAATGNGAFEDHCAIEIFEDPPE